MPRAPMGQHVLRDAQAIRRMVRAAGLRPGDAVLDVGAGSGAIAEALARAVQPAGRVVAVELDPALARALRARRLPCVEVVEGDALAVPLPRVDAVVANPPFAAAAPLLLRLLDAGFGVAVLVLPRELAERAVARPGSERYGRLTVRLALASEAERLFDLPRRAFDPPPDVAASVVRLVPRAGPEGVEPALLDAVLAAAWASKRRTLRHALAPLAPALRASSGALTALLDERGWGTRRPGELAPEDYAWLARRLGDARGRTSP